MRDRVLLLFVTFVLSAVCKAEIAWIIAEKFKNPGNLLRIRRDKVAAFYIRGFPKGAWGTHLFPAMAMIESKADDVIMTSEEWASLERVRNTAVATGDYEAYVDQLRVRFCEGWSCCAKMTRESCSNPTPKAREVIEYMVDPFQNLPLSFAYRWCAQAWEQYRTFTDQEKRAHLMNEIEEYCPDPCHGNPCRNVKHVNNSVYCKIVGPFENDYTCDCKNYSVWNPNLMICQRINPCLNIHFSPCKTENTATCVARDEETAVCICKPEYMGKDCSLPRDACRERINKSHPTGYTLCQVNLGNECHPILGTDAYTCVCRYGYAPSFHISEDNCLTRLDPCRNSMLGEESNETMLIQDGASLRYELADAIDEGTLAESLVPRTARIIHRGITCMNGGYCITSADYTRAVCKCPTSHEGEPLYIGLNCEIPVGVWSGWSRMTNCIPPDCGKNRYRWRRRRCLNATGSHNLLHAGLFSRKYAEMRQHFIPQIHCIGASEEVIPCDPMDPCAVIRLPGYLRDEILNYETLYYFGYITAAQVFLSFLSWYVLIIPVKKFIKQRKLRRGAAIIA